MDKTTREIDGETLANLLYLSRLSPESTDIVTLEGQVRQIVDYFQILSRFAGDENPYDAYPSTTVEALRSGPPVKALEPGDLKKISDEYMDGYFRVPKVLGGGA